MKLTKDYYSLSEISKILGVTLRTLYNYVDEGKLKATKQAGIWKVEKAELDTFLKGKPRYKRAKAPAMTVELNRENGTDKYTEVSKLNIRTVTPELAVLELIFSNGRQTATEYEPLTSTITAQYHL